MGSDVCTPRRATVIQNRVRLEGCNAAIQDLTSKAFTIRQFVMVILFDIRNKSWILAWCVTVCWQNPQYVRSYRILLHRYWVHYYGHPSQKRDPKIYCTYERFIHRHITRYFFFPRKYSVLKIFGPCLASLARSRRLTALQAVHHLLGKILTYHVRTYRT